MSGLLGRILFGVLSDWRSGPLGSSAVDAANSRRVKLEVSLRKAVFWVTLCGAGSVARATIWFNSK